MFYDGQKSIFISDQEMAARGLPIGDFEALAQYGFFPVDIEQPEYNPDTQGLEPDGAPEPDKTIRYLLVQRMKVVDLLNRIKTDKLAELAGIRWQRQTQGLTLDDLSVLTSPTDQDRLMTTIQSMETAKLPTTDFKTASGWRTLTLAELKEISGYVGLYVQTCYANERCISERIQAAPTIGALNEIDLEAGWPKNTYKKGEEVSCLTKSRS